ncbi:hypothetical protein GWO43_23915 [candidate division KSB1 bacterium]|nr:hypothetical protein [candidate division KSB1 bacterium]NIR73317.1 hypothetical protein [candidate division KSB1 bacterium]NIS27023.1 hypothetical protein [candidate division KSB1 bacterium]NIT73863.1 hypothetical protein [candidate division KSB1 bacterium]NIU27768.1 hypothetical protein [candidate division KSB1 bacterium]
MKTSNLILFAFSLSLALIIFVLPSCEHNVVEPPEREPQNSFFPLAVGNWWEYEVTYAPNLDSTVIPHLSFMTQIIGKINLREKTYYMMQEYSSPDVSFPDTLFIRSKGDTIFVRVEGEDLLLYNFNPKGDTLWTIPYLLQPKEFPNWQNCILLSSFASDSIIFHWNYCDPLEEAAWDEHFVKGKGRVRIIQKTIGFGTVIWELVNSKTKGD